MFGYFLLMSEFQIIKPYFKKYFFRLFVGIIAVLSVDFFQLCIPRLLKTAVDELGRFTPDNAIILRSALIISLLALLIAALRFIWRYLILGFSRLLEMELRNRLFSHILTLDRAFFQQRRAGDIMALSTNDLQAVQLACGMGVVASLDAVIMGLAALCCMIYIHPTLTAIALLPMPLLVIGARLLTRRLGRIFGTVQEQFSNLTEFSRDAITSIRLIKAYNQEETYSSQFDKKGKIYVRNNFRLAFVHGTLFPLSSAIANASLLLVLCWGGRLVIDEEISIGDFIAFIAYLYMLTWPMMAMGWVVNLFQRGRVSLQRIQEIFTARPLFAEAEHPETIEEIQTIHLRNLSFSYPGSSQLVLRNINLLVRPGILGIVGKTGSGKTTLCHLLTRLYPVEGGMAYFDDHDVNKIGLADLRSHIAYIPQEVQLFSDSIAHNIRLGKNDATIEEVETAARMAVIHDEIMAMPDGYETRIGEKGILLSGGQRQRIALARGLLLNRPIMIIDDSFSAVDMETENKVIENLAEFLRERICILVSHRIAPLRSAREIIVLENGAIVDKGTHEELQLNNDFYRAICRRQQIKKI